MKTYKCIVCGAKFNDVDLTRFKCSENFVGTYKREWCPKCINKRKAVYSVLEELDAQSGRDKLKWMLEHNCCETDLARKEDIDKAAP